MPQTSRFGYAIRFDSTLLGSGKPVDAGLVGDSLVNNACHLVDVQPQPLVNWISASSATYRTPIANVTTGASPICVYGPLPLQLLPDGRCPVIVASVAGAADSGTPTITMFLALRPYSRASAAVVSRPRGSPVLPDPGVSHPSNGSATFATSTAAWSSTPILLRMTEAQTAAVRAAISVPHVAGGAVPSGVQAALAQLEVWARTSDAARTPRLFGVHAHEFTGIT